MSSVRTREETARKLRALIETEGRPVFETTNLHNRKRYQAFSEIGDDRDELRTLARAIKEDALERLPALISELSEVIEGRGGHLLVAEDAADATRYIHEVASDAGVESVVKSKSMTSEEIRVNEHLEARGIEVHETDLGELIIQVAGERPSHLVAPGIHKSRDDIADLFNRHFDPAEKLETPRDLTRFAANYLADRIEEADLGMTGANFIIAETGSIVLITNEGNDRKLIEGTDVHVAVAGIEKIIPTLSDLAPFVELVARSSTGQSITAYTSILSPPVNTPPLDGADRREFHLVLVDNGRSAMRTDEELRETLYCVRCGACANVCANFQHVGGHGFGGETYTGGIATGWEAGVYGLESAATFNDLCSGCSRCVPACPVKIDIPWINEVVRDRINRGADPSTFDHLVAGLTPDVEPSGIDLQKRFFGNIGAAAAIASTAAPVSNWIAATWPNRWVLERVFGVDRRRDLPTFRRRTFRKWFDERPSSTRTVDPVRKAVIYPDIYTNFVEPDRGIATVRTLELLGVEPVVPALPESGRAPLSQGMIETARVKAAEMSDRLSPYIDDGLDVVVIEPSDLAMFRHDYERFLTAPGFERLSGRSYDVMEYIYGLLSQDGASPDVLTGPSTADAGRIVYHAHCQLRTLGLERYAVAVLEAAGFEVSLTDAECCGMAGSFGYKSQYFDLAMDIGASLEAEINSLNGRVVTSGTSCTDQLDSLLGERPPHVIELVAPG